MRTNQGNWFVTGYRDLTVVKAKIMKHPTAMVGHTTLYVYDVIYGGTKKARANSSLMVCDYKRFSTEKEAVNYAFSVTKKTTRYVRERLTKVYRQYSNYCELKQRCHGERD